MNSIKNAIVTVTLLAVGYGSYIVLSEPQPGDGQGAFGIVADPGIETISEGLPELEIDQQVNSLSPQDPTASQTPSDAPTFSPPANFSAPQDLPDLANTSVPQLAAPTSSRSSTNAVTRAAAPPSRFGAVPDSLPALNLESPAVTTNAPATPDFPELPPLPDLIETPQDSRIASEPMPSSNPSLSVEQPPQLEFNQPETTMPAATLSPSNEGTAPNLTIESPIERSVAGPDTRIDPAPLAEFPSHPNHDAVGKSPANLVAPNEIDVQPVNQATVTAILPPIDPSVGPIPPAPNEGSVAFERTWGEVQEIVRNQDAATALRILTPWSSDANLNSEQQDRCFRMLDELAGSVIYSTTSHLEPAYTVQAGETLEEIAATYSVPKELLAKINGIRPPYALSTGETLKVVRGPFRAEVSLANNRLTLYAGAHYAGRFDIQIGPDLPPEEAFYEVGEKSLGRNYFDRRSGSEVLRGAENNRYGEHWIGLRGEHITTGHSVGIHGRAKVHNPQDVGCVSLDAIDAGDVFSILSIGSRVQVRR